MLALLRTPRWLGFTTLVVAAIVGFGLLSNWQWHRAQEKNAQRTAIDSATKANPIELSTMNAAATDWQGVRVSGSYDAQGQVLARQRPQGGQNGFWVLTPLMLDDGRDLWVVRGWLRAGSAATTTPAIPDPPAGEVTLVGSWHQFEIIKESARSGLPPKMVGAVDPSVLPRTGNFNGYLRVVASTPSQTGLDFIARPQIDDSMNLSYAGQWLLFAGVALVGWYFFLRREAKDDRAAKTQATISAT